MPIRFTLNTDFLSNSKAGLAATRGAACHSRLAANPRSAWALLEKLERIHGRQLACGSPASEWDPVKTWREMLKDCCSDIVNNNG